MKKLFSGLMTTVLMSATVCAYSGDTHIPTKKHGIKKEATCKDNCTKKDCSKKTNCPTKPGCICPNWSIKKLKSLLKKSGTAKVSYSVNSK